MNIADFEKRFFIVSLKEMKKSLSYVREEQRHTGRIDIEDDSNLLKLSLFLDFLIEKELKELKGE